MDAEVTIRDARCGRRDGTGQMRVIGRRTGSVADISSDPIIEKGVIIWRDQKVGLLELVVVRVREIPITSLQ